MNVPSIRPGVPALFVSQLYNYHVRKQNSTFCSSVQLSNTVTDDFSVRMTWTIDIKEVIIPNQYKKPFFLRTFRHNNLDRFNQ